MLQPSSRASSRKECEGRRRACHALVMGRCLCTKKPLACARKGVGSHQQTFSAEGHREFGNREWISWLRSDATKSRGRRFSPSQGFAPVAIREPSSPLQWRDRAGFTPASPFRDAIQLSARTLVSRRKAVKVSRESVNSFLLGGGSRVHGAAGAVPSLAVPVISRKRDRMRSATSGLPSVVNRRSMLVAASRSTWKARARAYLASRARPSWS